jgi:hypothetical protein
MMQAAQSLGYVAGDVATICTSIVTFVGQHQSAAVCKLLLLLLSDVPSAAAGAALTCRHLPILCSLPSLLSCCWSHLPA